MTRSRVPAGDNPARRRGLLDHPLALIAVVAVGLTACTATPVEEPSVTAPAESAIDWTVCGASLECADVTAPVDWADPEGEQLTLAVIRRLASKPDDRVGALFINPGGPAESGLRLVRDLGAQIDEWGDGRFDVVSWDPRGTNASTGVNCFESVAEAARFWAGVAVPSSDSEVADFTRRTTELALRCGEVIGPLLSHISTTDTARDLEHLRQLVGEDDLTYIGLSYGTIIGQVYANLFPDRVRAMVLDGVLDPIAFTTSAEAAAATSDSADEVFEQFLALCEQAGQQICALAGHGETVAARVGRVFEQAKQGPIPVPSGAGALTYSDLVVTTFAALNDPSTWSDLAAGLNAAADGDVSPMMADSVRWHSADVWTYLTTSAAIQCLDAPADRPIADWPQVIGDLTSESQFSAPVIGWPTWALCASGWPAADDDRYTGPWDAETAPILLIGTRYDPASGHDGAVRAERLLGNAVLLTHQGYGHLSLLDPSACVDAVRTQYLEDLELPEPGTVCEADKKPFP